MRMFTISAGLVLTAIAFSQLPTLDQRRQKVIDLTNAERRKESLPPLGMDPRLNEAAQAHADDMAKRGYFAHDSPGGEGPGDRLKRAGFEGTAWGENIALGQRTVAEAVASWMKSSGHRKNILNRSYTLTGVGYVKSTKGKTYWVQVFGLE